MRVTVLRSEGRRHRAVVSCDDGSVVTVHVYGDGDALPHDLVHWAVERELGVADGYWAMVRHGGGRSAPGHDLGGPEDLVLSFAEVGHEGAPDGLSEDDLARVRAALDDLHGRWKALPVGARLVLDWPPDT